MTTAADIITLALKDIGVLDETETPSAALMADSLTTLNQMLGLWQTQNLYIYAKTDISFPATGAQSYTIGPASADITSANPAKINYAYLNLNSLDYPLLDILPTFDQWQEIGLKSLPNTYPQVLYFNPTSPSGVIYLYPQPSTGTMHIGVDVQLPTYSLAADAFSLPIEYEFLVRFSLCKILSAMMGRPLRADLKGFADMAMRMVQRNNAQIAPLKLEGQDTGVSDLARIKRGY
jgi:hypothetical protein